jgi:hypothetical protein
VRERSEIAHKRADETFVEQFVGRGFLAVVLSGSEASLVGTGEQSIRTVTVFGTESFVRSEWLPP